MFHKGFTFHVCSPEAFAPGETLISNYVASKIVSNRQMSNPIGSVVFLYPDLSDHAATRCDVWDPYALLLPIGLMPHRAETAVERFPERPRL